MSKKKKTLNYKSLKYAYKTTIKIANIKNVLKFKRCNFYNYLEKKIKKYHKETLKTI